MNVTTKSQSTESTKRYWLYKLRKDHDLTQEQIAKLAGIERSTYTKAENGYPVSIETAKAIGKVFGISWVKFFEE
ncbi:hypothetical protein GCM10010965_27330 [Caldalkalibacillus thermarum]|uniref:helix-turn-helix transcriptional regulator n=1 Tax=Caldalkalibacillus thermarum TaxID=296745 RepID=UPI00166C5847|nr:helix-turn-helix transcriptional regulator [Caldalkalibacillus thermarum]GGK32987.1 hypothetical protein GCM10010965_27330 [Caldalkalibacillus thermarum]